MSSPTLILGLYLLEVDSLELFPIKTNNDYFFCLFQWTIKHQGLDAVMNYGCEFEVKMKKDR